MTWAANTRDQQQNKEMKNWYDMFIDPFRRFERWIKGKTLDLFNQVLGSLGSAGVPFVGLIQEFKEVTETMIEEKNIA